jgi:hypothetical protein
MRALFWIVAAVAAAYAGLWFVGERQVETRAAQALADLEARGWQVDYASLNTTGFPSRLDTRVTDLRLLSPDGRLGWVLPALQVYALVYRPTHVIADLPPEQVVTVAGREFDLTSQALRASGRGGLSARLPFREAVVEGGPLTVAGEGVELSLGRLLLAAREGGPGANAYDLYLDAGDIRPAEGAPALDLLRLDAQVTLDRPIDRTLRGAPGLLDVALRDARLTMGDVALSASGALAPDAEGALAGEVVIVAENWRGMLDLGEQAGTLDPARRAIFERALEGLAEGDRIEVPVTFANGTISALGLPLLAAPRLPPAQPATEPATEAATGP